MSGASSDCFLQNICSENQIFPRIFYYLRTAKNFETTVPFEVYLINSLRFFEGLFSLFTCQVRIFFNDKRKTKIFALKTVMERGIIKFLIFVIRQISSKNFREIISSPCNFEKNSNRFPQADRTDANFLAPLRMHFQRSKFKLDSLKSVLNTLGGNCRWVPMQRGNPVIKPLNYLLTFLKSLKKFCMLVQIR